MNSKEQLVLDLLTGYFVSIPIEYFKPDFSGFVPFASLVPNFDWMFVNDGTPKLHNAIRHYHFLEGACAMAFRCGYTALFNLATWEVRIENV